MSWLEEAKKDAELGEPHGRLLTETIMPGYRHALNVIDQLVATMVNDSCDGYYSKGCRDNPDIDIRTDPSLWCSHCQRQAIIEKIK